MEIKKMKKVHVIITSVFLMLFLTVTHSHSQDKPAGVDQNATQEKQDISEQSQENLDETEAPEAEKEQEATNINQQTYRDWLEHYKAFDKLDKVYEEKGESADTLMIRSALHLESGDPAAALALVESISPFEDETSKEIRRLWIGGQAQRALGDPSRAVAWFSQAGALMSKESLRQKYQSEPGLNSVWKDVFRQLYWMFAENTSLARDGQSQFLQVMLEQGGDAWGTVDFWGDAAKVLNLAVQQEPLENQASTLGAKDRRYISRMLAGACLELDDANATLPSIKNQGVGAFWQGVYSWLTTGVFPVIEHDYKKDSLLKAELFMDRAIFPDLEDSKRRWLLSDTSSEFTIFRSNLMIQGPEKAYEIMQTGKQDSLRIGPGPLQEEFGLHFALALLNNDTGTARELWESIDPITLPFSLRLAGAVLFGTDPSVLFPEAASIGDSWPTVFTDLYQAAGYPSPQPHEAPLWVSMQPKSLQKIMATQWPLDPDVILAAWQQQWTKSPTADLARRMAFLFPERQLGVAAFLFLAGKAVRDKQLQLAEYYMGQVNPEDANATLAADRLEILAEMRLAQDDIEGAYQRYQDLVKSGAEISDVTRLKIAFLLQQRGELVAGREHLLKLWDKKDTMDTAMQSEILFYLGEGEQAMGQSDQALDYFLTLAWQYPQESMWALTAMYRASNIYEAREQYEPARRLLKTVINNAQTSKQREAAKARLESIEGKMGRTSGPGTGSVPYPF